ncbi:MAG: hypothetical protein Fur0023_00920 [Bacteroidia bacterium]
MAAKKKSKKANDKKKKSVQKQAKPAKKKNDSPKASKVKKKQSKASKKAVKKKITAKQPSVKKKSASTSAKTSKSSKKSSQSSVKNKATKKAVKKSSVAKKNVRKSSIAAKKTSSKSQITKSNGNKKTLPKEKSSNTKKKVSNVKFTKADAAKTQSATSSAQTSPERSTLSTGASVTKKETVSKKNDTSPKETITIEKVMEKTEDKNFLPKSLQSTEKTGFSDSLSEDLSSVYARTSEEMPEPPGKYDMEFICKAAPELLYKFLTDPVELAEWFCDSVNIRNGIYTFVWNGMPQQARWVKQERNVSVRYQWLDKNDGSYFEFNIFKNYLTGDVVLYVTDFSGPEELESNKLWWTNQINKLKTILGLQY